MNINWWGNKTDTLLPQNKTSLVANELKGISNTTGAHMKIYYHEIDLIWKFFIEKIVFKNPVYISVIRIVQQVEFEPIENKTNN